mmetsp:Transcript_24079/g.58148  ORF Transcript_24079/g.58148 Transcript_24079/m.58148 type:complete len:89 (-) Transcript_24079:244-510(-)
MMYYQNNTSHRDMAIHVYMDHQSIRMARAIMLCSTKPTTMLFTSIHVCWGHNFADNGLGEMCQIVRVALKTKEDLSVWEANTRHLSIK